MERNCNMRNHKKIKRQYALDKLFNVFIIIGCFLLYASYVFQDENSIGLVIGTGIFGLLFIIGAIILIPCCYGFDSEGVTMYYVFSPNERYLWRNIRAIEVSDDGTNSSHTALFDVIFGRVFAISGYVEGEYHFYMNGHIRKSWRTKRLIEKYWDGTITGYFWENFIDWWNKSKNKKRKQPKHRLTDEIIPMEKDMKAKIKQCIIPYHDKIRQYGFEIRRKYIYITKNLDELNSRPSEGYTYIALVEISCPGETDEDKIWCFSVDLLYVRLGKNAYKGVKNKNALMEMEYWLRETMQEIKNNG